MLLQHRITESSRPALATLFVTLLLSGMSALAVAGINSPFIYIGTLGVASIVILRYPLAGVTSAIAATMIWERFFTLTPFALGETLYKLYPLDVVLLVTVLAVAVQYRAGHFKRPVFSALDRTILTWTAVITLLFLFSTFLAETKFDLAFSTWKNYVFYALLYVAMRYLVRSAHDFSLVIRTMLWSGVAIIVFQVIGLAQAQGLWTEFTPLSTEGKRLLAPTHAFYLTLPFIILLFRSEIKRYASEFLRWRPWLLWIWGFGALVSLTRHLWVSLVAQIGALYAQSKEARVTMQQYAKKPIAVILVLGAIMLWLFALAPSLHTNIEVLDEGRALMLRFSSFFSTGDVSFDWRKSLWQESIQLYADNPWLGIGFGREITFPLPGFIYTTEVRNLHNSPLGILLQGGLVAMIAFLFMLLGAWRLYRAHTHDILPYAAMLGGFLVNSLFGTYFEINLLVLFFWLILGLMRARIEAK